MTAAQPTSVDRIRDYLARLSQQARCNLLTEIERLQLHGEDVSSFSSILAELRAEFRKDGENSHRIGNPSRYFFQPIEELLVDRSPEKANAGQISRGSLSAVWEWINHELLRTMARDYCETIKNALVAGQPQKASQLADGFQSKVVKSLQATLASEAGLQSAQAGLGQYTSSHACINDLRKMVGALQIRQAIAAFDAALPPKIDHLEGDALMKVQGLLDGFVAKHPQGLAFALTIAMKRLAHPWQIALLAIQASHSRSAEDIAATRYGIAVSMVLDHLEDRHVILRQALKTSRVEAAKGILGDIYEIEYQLRHRIGRFEESEWGKRLDEFMASLTAELEAELHTLPDGTRHVLGAFAHRRHGGLLHFLARTGRDALAGGAAYYEKLIGSDHKQAG
jgi:hypothetical protein